MTYFQYYATTSRNLDRVLQYGVYPLAQWAGSVFAGRYWKGTDEASKHLRDRMASDFARVVSATVYSALTTGFLGAESEMIDHNAREAVSAEMGVDPKQLKFSDYKYSKNVIVSNAQRDMVKLQKYRYFTDGLFLLPTVLRGTVKVCGGKWPEADLISKDPYDSHTDFDRFLNWHNAWNYSVYAGKAMYWAGETYFIDKSGHYEIVKLMETLKSTGKDMSVNDLLGVYQRTRATDLHLPMIEKKEEYDVLRPLLQKMTDAYNKHDNKFAIPEIVYLFGLNKINIHAEDNKTVSQDAVAQSSKEIDTVLSLGLKGIREERKKLREAAGMSNGTGVIHSKTLRDRLEDGAIGAARSFAAMFRSKKNFHPEEYISVRNPGEQSGILSDINR